MAQLVLRDWQIRCKETFHEKLRTSAASGIKPVFRVEACVGAGKSAMMAELAYQMLVGDLIEEFPIDFAVFVAPNRAITGMHGSADREAYGIIGALERRGIWAMERITATGNRMPGLMARPQLCQSDAGLIGAAAVFTYQYLLQPRVQDTLCEWAREGLRIGIFYDESHHTPEQGTAWSQMQTRINSATVLSCYFSGTWFRTDNRTILGQIVDGSIERDVTYRYADGIHDGIVRPLSFWIPNTSAKAYDQSGMLLDDRPVAEYLDAIPPEVRKELFDPDGWFVEMMIKRAAHELTQRRTKYTDAGCLVICPPGFHDPEDDSDAAIEERDRIAERIHCRVCELTGQRATLVLNGHPDSLISDFRESDHEFIVAVNRISEGCDIPRLRVLLLLRELQELQFNQAIGRVIRRRADDDIEPALVVMPPIHQMCELARSVNVARAGAAPKSCDPCAVCGRMPCKCPCPRCGKSRPCKCPCRYCGKRPCICPPVAVDQFIEVELEGIRDEHIIHGVDIENRYAARAGKIREHVSACQHRDLADMAFLFQLDEQINGVVSTAPPGSGSLDTQTARNQKAVATGANWCRLRDEVPVKVRKLKRFFKDPNPYQAANRFINRMFFPGTKWSAVKDDPARLPISLLEKIHEYLDRVTKGDSL